MTSQPVFSIFLCFPLKWRTAVHIVRKVCVLSVCNSLGDTCLQVRFVKDKRNHRTEKLLNENWKEVCGPALCIFNDACFTPRDMEGIQALGEGSKEGDALKIGK